VGNRHSRFRLYEPVAVRLVAVTRITYGPLMGRVKFPWLSDRRMPTRSPVDAYRFISTLAALPGFDEKPPVLVSASEMISPAWPLNANRSTSPVASMRPDARVAHGSGTASGLGVGNRHSRLRLYEPVAVRLVAVTRITYGPLTGSVKVPWLSDRRMPTRAPVDAYRFISTLAALPGFEEKPPVLVSASEMISPAWPLNVNKSTSPIASMRPDARVAHGSGTASGLGVGNRHSRFRLYEPVAVRFVALTRISYTPPIGSVKFPWLFDRRMPTRAPVGA